MEKGRLQDTMTEILRYYLSIQLFVHPVKVFIKCLLCTWIAIRHLVGKKCQHHPFFDGSLQCSRGYKH